jgi:hypothetical protein
MTAYQKEYKERYKEQIAKKRKEYYEKNKEKILANHKKWREAKKNQSSSKLPVMV